MFFVLAACCPLGCHGMATKDLCCYFKQDTQSSLPNGISQSTINAVNKEVVVIASTQNDDFLKTRGEYIKVTAKDQTTIGEYGVKNRIAAAIRHFKCNEKFPALKEATVWGWKNAYCNELLLQSSRKHEPVEIGELPKKCQGRPLLLGEELEHEVKSFIKVAREKGTIVNMHTIIATTRGFVISHDANLLFENGDYSEITKSWTQRLLERRNLVKRKRTTAIKVLFSNFEKLKKQFLSDVCSTVVMEDIPEKLIINWDQTGLKYVPVSNWRFADKGSKRVEIAGLDNKRQLTVLLSCTMKGKLLTTQVIYAGKTPACLPKADYPSDWFLTYTETIGPTNRQCWIFT